MSEHTEDKTTINKKNNQEDAIGIKHQKSLEDVQEIIQNIIHNAGTAIKYRKGI